MKKNYHPANERGAAHHGWLKSKHTYNFADYYHPKRNGFGALKVINDDYVEGGAGFSTHSHRNMEIVSIPLTGALVHKDNMGNESIIRAGEVQVMSAGTGVSHSEMNASADIPVTFLQIWIEPSQKEVTPRYQQVNLQELLKPNEFVQIISPDPDDGGVWIRQNAWFNVGQFSKGVTKTYALHNCHHGVYVFVIFGEVVIGGQLMHTRDGIEITETKYVTIDVVSDAQVLLIEVPLSNKNAI